MKVIIFDICKGFSLYPILNEFSNRWWWYHFVIWSNRLLLWLQNPKWHNVTKLGWYTMRSKRSPPSKQFNLPISIDFHLVVWTTLTCLLYVLNLNWFQVNVEGRRGNNPFFVELIWGFLEFLKRQTPKSAPFTNCYLPFSIEKG